ncbi:hypothetical protein K435DRAFT_807724 [Dendrothele bispora CBS 962.96]|uniref:Uncharacterized protein n=1 Tax=Dendrothele bispora (strain CBS 962.96) TaxID=1314807 RepID=A0A4V4HCG6_DENBC|nr:hypothetical protein K435DRAFT_807724 [Dendrothele bispora CBS 962.96]
MSWKNIIKNQVGINGYRASMGIGRRAIVGPARTCRIEKKFRNSHVGDSNTHDISTYPSYSLLIQRFFLCFIEDPGEEICYKSTEEKNIDVQEAVWNEPICELNDLTAAPKRAGQNEGTLSLPNSTRTSATQTPLHEFYVEALEKYADENPEAERTLGLTQFLAVCLYVQLCRQNDSGFRYDYIWYQSRSTSPIPSTGNIDKLSLHLLCGSPLDVCASLLG